MRTRPDGRGCGPWRHPEFRKLWAARTISLLGSQITVLALPLTAVLTLGASAAEMGVLTAVQFAPVLVVGLVAGVWVDRLRRRPLLIASDLGQAVLLGAIPVAAALGVLRIEYLYAVGFLKGALEVIGQVAAGSFLPSVVGRERLAEANGRLTMSQSVAGVAGPGLGGALVQLVTAPVALAADALSFVVSAAFLGWVRTAEAAPLAAARRSTWAEMSEGLRLVLGRPLLRALAGSQGLLNFFAGAITAIDILFITGDLGVAPAVLGTLLAASSLAAPVGAVLAPRLVARFGLGPAMIGALAVFAAAHLPVPLAAGAPAAATATLLAVLVLIRLALPVYEVSSGTLQQAVTPDRLRGRVGATTRLVFHGAVPLGALLGGAVGEAVGLRPAYTAAALGQLLAVLWLFLSPVRRLRAASAPTEPEAPPIPAGTSA